jgi:hypothetical protein
LFPSGFGVALFPISDGMEASVAAGAGHPLFLGETLRRMDYSVPSFAAGLGVSMDAAIAALDGCSFVAIKLQI